MFMDYDDLCDIRDEFYGPDYDNYDYYEGRYADEYNNYDDDDYYDDYDSEDLSHFYPEE